MRREAEYNTIQVTEYRPFKTTFYLQQFTAARLAAVAGKAGGKADGMQAISSDPSTQLILCRTPGLY